MLSPWRVLTLIALCLGAVMGVLTAVAVGSAAAPATASLHRGTASIHHAALQAPVPGQAPAPGPQEVTGPVGTLPDGAFPAGMNVVAELPGLRTATSNTYLTSSGSRVLMAYPGPVNYHDPSGALQHIDNSAVASTGGGWHNGANAYQADVPASLTQPVSITAGSASLAFTFLGAQVGSAGAVLTPSGATATARASTVTFESSLPDTSISYAFGGDGLGESLTLQNAAAPTI